MSDTPPPPSSSSFDNTADTATDADVDADSSMVVTERDFQIVKRQLRRGKISRPARVLRRCVWGYPQLTFAFSRAGASAPATTATSTAATETGGRSAGDADNKPIAAADDAIDSSSSAGAAGATHSSPGTAAAAAPGQASSDVQYSDQHLPGTLIWLTCPRVRDMVSKWESRGGISTLRQQFGLPTGRSDTQRQRKKLRTIVAEATSLSSSGENDNGSSGNDSHLNAVEAVTAAAVGLESGEEIPPETRRLLQSHENYKAWLRDGGLLSREEYNKWRTGNVSTGDDVPDRRFGNAAVSVAASIKCAHAHMATFMIPGVEDYVGRATFEHLKKAILPEPEYQEGGGPPVQDMEDLHVLDCPSCNVTCRKFDPKITEGEKM